MADYAPSELIHPTGFNTSLTKTQFGTLPDDMTRANMTAIAEEILPAFRGRLPEGKRAVQAAE